MLRDLLRRHRPARKQRVAPQAEWLEPRLLYSADAGVLLVGATTETGDVGELRQLASNYEYGSASADTPTSAQVQAAYALTKLQFEANAGQLGAGVDFAAHGLGYAVELAGGQAQLLLAGADQPVTLQLVDAQPGTAEGQDLQATRSNYLVGQDASKWATDLANYGSVLYRGVYDGIDVRYYGNQSQLEYDFLLAPGADAARLQLRFDGTDAVSIDGNGDLVLQVAGTDRTLRFQAPVSYQQGAGGREAVESHYAIGDDGTVRIVVGDYDHARALVVDPVLSHASYFGESAAETALGVAIGNDGSVYVTGQTQSTSGTFQTRLANGTDSNEAYVAKFNGDLTTLWWATRVGGKNNEEGTSIAVDAAGGAIVTGWTTSPDFVGASTTGDRTTLAGGQDAFVFRLAPSGGAIDFTDFFGGSGTDTGAAVAVDSSGNVYAAGTINDGSDNAFVNKYNATGNVQFKLQYGGSNADSAKGIAVDAAGSIYVVGNTLSAISGMNGAQTQQPTSDDAFLVKYDSSGSITYSTYIGGSNSDYASAVAVDDSGRAYVVGRTKSPSTSGFTTTANAFDITAVTHTTGYLRVFNTGTTGSASLEYSSFIGGTKNASGSTAGGLTDNPTGVAVLGGQVAILGTSDTSNLPTTPDAIQATNTSGKATGFVMVLKPQSAGSADLVYGTYYGTSLNTGAVAWGNNRVYLVGSTTTTGLGYQGARTTVAGSTDGLVAAIGGFANNAPVLGGSNNFSAQLEDTAAAGTLVSDLVSGKITDDTGAAKGIAIIGADTSNGSWQYSLNNGSTWTALASPASGSAFLLAADAQTRLRFVPNTNYSGTSAGITFRAWDRTAGFAGTTVTVSGTGGSTAYSTATALASVTVNAVNDAPVRSGGTLSAVSAVEGGAAVSLGLGSLAYSGGPASATDEATQNLTYTVTGLPTAIGTVQLADGSAVTLNASYTLAQLQTLQFLPGSTGSGSFTFSVRDDGGTANGGQDTLSQSLAITVTNVAPVLNGANALASQLEDVAGNGTLVSDILAGQVSDAGGKYGIAVTSIPNGMNNVGTWQYSTDGGTTWQTLTGTTNASLLLAADSLTRIRLLAAANWNGTPPGFTFRAWDRSSGTAGGTADTSTSGGSTAFSSASLTAQLTVVAVNDAPFRYNVSTSTVLPAPSDVIVDEGTGTTSLGLGYLQYIAGPALDEYQTQAITGYAVTAVPDSATVGRIYLADGVTLVAPGSYTLAQIQGMVFKPATGVQSGTGTFSWTVSDNGGTANGGVDTLVESITVGVRNLAPKLAGVNNFTGILEDATGNSGTLVSDLVNGMITDPSGNIGVAVTGVTTTNGTWQYTQDNGSTWSTLTASTTSSLLLRGDNKTKIRFLPNADYNGTTAGVLLRAWDRSTGTIGGTADTTLNGGNTAFSSASFTASITVGAVNDAPVRTAGSVAGVVLLDGSATTSLGLSGLAFAAGPSTATDEAGQTPLKYTVTGLPTAGGVSLGQILLSDGVTVVAANTQYTLTQIQGMKFKSAGTGVLGTGALTFTVQDTGGTANGGVDTLVQSVSVIVNRAPVLNGANAVLTVYEDFNSSGSTPQGNPPAWANPAQRAGMLVSDLIANQITDTAGSSSGIAVTALAGSGTWQFTTDGGTIWTTVSSVSNTGALLLAADSNTRLRFLPSADWNSVIGTASVTFRAWDQTTGSNGGTADTSWNGGPSAYSAATATSVVTVVAVNDAPVRNGTPVSTSVSEAGGTSTLGLAGVSYAPGPATATDETTQVLTFKVTAIPSTLVKVFLADGVTPVTTGTVYTLAQLQTMVYQALPGATPGSGTFSFTVQDDGGVANGGADTLTQNLTLTVTNVAPVLAGANAMPAILEDSAGSGTLVADLVSGKITDPGGRYGIAVTMVDNTNGSWQYSLDGGSSWTAFGAASTSSARLLAADTLTRVRFVPGANWNGSTSFGFLAWDRSSGTAGGTGNAGSTGGSTPYSTAGATVTLAVTPVNDAPVLTATAVTALTVAEDSGSTSLGLGSIGYGPGGGSDEANQALTYTVTALPPASLGQVTLADGTLVVAGDYTLLDLRGMRFVTAADAGGSGTFSFRVRDSGGTADGGVDTLAQDIQLSVSPVNDPPTLVAGTVADLAVDEDSGGTSLGLGTIAYGPGGGSDEAGQQLTYTVTTLPPAALARILLADGTVVTAGSYLLADLQGMRFETAADASGSGSFSFSVRDDGGGSDTLVQTIAITVNPVNDPPVRTAGSVADLTVAEDSGTTGLGLDAVAYAPDGGADEAGQALTYTVTAVPPAAFGHVELADGTLVAAGVAYGLDDLRGMRFVTAADANGTATFAFDVTDSGGGDDTLSQSLTITVTPANDPPVATAGTTTVGRGGTVTDVVNASDVDAGDTLTVTLVSGPAHGLLTLNTDGTYSYTHDGSANYSDSFDFLVTDAAGQSSSATVSITITPGANNAPSAQAGTATLAEGDTCNGTVTFTDPDLPADTLVLSVVTGPTHGTVVLNQDGSYSYAHDGTESFTDRFTYRVTDSYGASSQASVAITITPVNDNTPVAQPGSATVAEGGSVSGAVVATDADLPNDSLALAVVSGPAHGSLLFNANGSYTYTHDGSENFADSFRYKVTDANGASSEATVTLTITPVNDNAPVAQNGSGTLAEGGTFTGAVSVSDVDLPYDTLTVSLVTGPTHGGLALGSNGSFTYTHDGSENFSDSFIYRVTDAKGASKQATWRFTITPVNDNAPVAQAGSASVDEGGTVAGAVQATDADLPYDTLTFALVSGPAHGGLSFGTDGRYVYTHDGSENFSDGFVYVVTDAKGRASQASVSIGINPVNDNTPVAQDGSASVDEGGTVTGTALAGDLDLPNDSLTFSLASGPAHGNVTLDANGNYSYTHDGSENFADSFLFQVSDGKGATSTARITLAIAPVNDNAPVALDGGATLLEGGTAAGNVAATDADLPNDTLTYTLVSGPAHGNLVLNADGSYSYTHDGSEVFGDGFVFAVTDANGATSQAGYTFTVTPVNDNTPVAQDGTAAVDEGGTVGGTVGASDTDLPNDALTYALVSGPAHGLLEFHADGSYSYTHDGSENFTDAFTFSVTDAAGASSQAGVAVAITPVNDNAPVAQDGAATLAEGAVFAGAVTAGDADLPNDTLTYGLVSGPTHGVLVLDTDGSFTYTHDGSENFRDAFVFAVTDANGASSQATYSLAITPVDDNAPLAQDGTATVLEGGTATGALAAADADLPYDTLTYALLTGPAHGSVTINADGSYSYTHDGSENFGDAFTFSVTDASGTSSQAGVTVAVTPVDDNPPVANDGSVTVLEGGAVSGTVSASDLDLPYDSLTFALVTGPAHGSLTVNPDGSYTYTHDGSENFADAFVFQVADGNGTTSQGTVSVGVTPVNDNAPVAYSVTGTVAEGGTIAGTVPVADADLPNDTLTLTLVSGPTHGVLSFHADGSYVYTHDGSENFSDGFVYQVADATGATSQGIIGFNITPVDDNPPVAQDASATVLEGSTVGGTLLATDVDLPNDTLIFAVVSGPAYGALTLNADGSYSYTHDGSENFVDGFTFSVTDSAGTSSQGSVTLAITPVNDNAPVAQAGGTSLLEGGSVSGAVVATDADLPNDAVTFALVSGPAHGLLTFNADGTYSYAHDGSENFADAFVFCVTDANGATSQASYAFTVTPVNDNAPVAQGGSATVLEGGAVNSAVTATDTDLPNDLLTYAVVTGPAHGQLTFNADGSYSYTHDGTENFADGFTFAVTDAAGHGSQAGVALSITPVNDNAPVAQGGSATVLEGGTVNSAVIASDTDLPNDTLTFTLVSGPAHGVLTFNADGSYSYAHDGSENFADGFTFAVTDAAGNSNQAGVALSITPVNDNAPAAQGGSATVLEGGTVNSAVTASDTDLPNDTLTYTLVSGPAHGNLVLNADGSYSYTHDGSENFSDAFVFSVTDANGASSQASYAFTVTPVNDNGPVAQGGSATVLEGGIVNGAVVATDTDLPNDSLTFTLVTGPTHGNLVLNADGSYSYTHDGSENFSDAFVFAVKDASGASSQASYIFTVTPVNDNAPVAQGGSATVLEGGIVNGAVTASDTDLPNDALTFILVSGPAHGLLTFNADGSYSYAHDGSENFADAFVFAVTDAKGATSQASYAFTVTPVNDNAPVARGGSANVLEGATVNGAVTASDIDLPNDTLTFALVSGPTHGNLVLNADGSYSYAHDGTENFSDAFVYAVTDANGATSQASYVFTVTPVNDNAPAAQDGSGTVLEGGTVGGTLVASDLDLPNDTLVFALVSGPAHGSLTIRANGSYSYTHDGSESFADAFVFSVTDANGESSQGRVTLAITPVNDNAPVAQAGTAAVLEGGTAAGAVTALDTDLPNDALTFALVSGPAHGVLTFNADGTFSYTHDGSETTSDGFVFAVTDANGASSQATFSLGITPVDDNAPVAQGGSATVLEGGTVDGAVTATDADLPNDTLTFTLVSGPSHGTLAFNADGTYSYAHDGSENFADGFTFSVTDAAGTSSQAAVALSITPLNDNAPVAQDASNSLLEGGVVSGTVGATDTDLPNDALTFALVSGPAHGTLAFGADGSYTYTHDGSENFADDFVFRVIDANGASSQARVTLAITPVNDSPPVAQGGSATLLEGGTLAGAVGASDADLPNDTLTFSLVSGPAHGNLTFNADGSFSYTHDGSENFADGFAFRVQDASGGTSQSSYGFAITPVNDNAPAAQGASASLAEGGSVVGTLVATDTDLPNDSLIFAVVSGPAHGTLAVNADGSYSYTHDGSENFADAFVFSVTDANGANSQGRVTLAITPVNDNVPVAQGETVAVLEGGTVAGAAGATDGDLPNDTLTFALVSGPAHGNLTFNADGSYSYTHDGSENFADAFVFDVTDANGSTSRSSVAFAITPVNDNAPVAQGGNVAAGEGGTVTATLAAADADLPNDALTFTLVSGPAHGTLAVNADGSYSYTHDGSENFADAFVFDVTDANGSTSRSSVAFAITPVNDNAPVAQGGNVAVGEGGTVTATLAAADADLPNDALTFTLVSGPAHGTLAVNADGSYSYTHDGSENFADAFVYAVTDANGASSQGRVAVAITPVDDPTLAVADTVTVNEDQVATGNVLANDSDVDSVLQVAGFSVAGSSYGAGSTVAIAGVGSFTLGANGAFTFTPLANWNGSVPQVVYATSTGAASTLDIRLNPVDDATVAAAETASVDEDHAATGNVLANDVDIDSALQVSGFSVAGTNYAAGATANLAGVGALTLAASGDWLFTPAANWNGTVPQLTYFTNTGATATLDISVRAVDDPTVAAADAATIDEDTAAAGNLLANDSDPDNALQLASFTVGGKAYAAGSTAALAGIGTFTVAADGAYSFTPAADWNGTVPTLGYTTNTGATAVLAITVRPVDDPAVVAPDTASVDEDNVAVGNVLANDGDIDSPLAVASFTVAGRSYTAGSTAALAGIGSFTLAAGGDWRFTPAADWNGSVPQVGYVTVTGAASTLDLTVRAVDDATVARPDSAGADEDSAARGNVLANDSDVDSTLQVAGFSIGGQDYAAGASAALAGIGSFTLGANGDWLFTPAADWNGAVPQVGYVTNTGAASTLDIAVRAVNDDPLRTSPAPADLVVVEGSGTTALPFANLAYAPGGGADEAGQALVVTVTTLPGRLGAIVLADGRTAVVEGGRYTVDQLRGMQFTAAAVSSGSAAFGFSVDDDAGGKPVSEQITISIVNQAPVLDGANALPAIAEDATGNTGMLVADLVAGHVTDPLGGTGIAVVGAQANGGHWEFSQDGGKTWAGFGSVSDGSAELLAADADTRVRFVPAADWNGDAGGLLFRAWDGSGGLRAGSLADASANGGSTPFSSAVAEGAITVQPVNDAPVRMGAGAAVPSVNVRADQTLASLQLADLAYAPGGGADEAGQALSVTVTELPPSNVGTVVLADGATPLRLGTSYTLAQFRGLQFVPAGASSGTLAQLAWVVRDDGGTAAGGSDAAAGTLRIVVNGADAAPAPVSAPAAAAPPAPMVVAPAAAPAPAPAHAATPAAASPSRVNGASADALMPAPAAAPLMDAASGFAPQHQQGAEGEGRPAYLTALEQHLVPFAGVNLAAPGDFIVTGFAGTEAPRISVDQFQQALRSGAFIDELNRLRRQLHDDFDLDRTTSITVAGVSLGVSVIYILWLLRGGVLLGSYLSALPAWRLLDPLPVLARTGDEEEDEDDEALGSLDDRAPDPLRGFT